MSAVEVRQSSEGVEEASTASTPKDVDLPVVVVTVS